MPIKVNTEGDLEFWMHGECLISWGAAMTPPPEYRNKLESLLNQVYEMGKQQGEDKLAQVRAILRS